MNRVGITAALPYFTDLRGSDGKTGRAFPISAKLVPDLLETRSETSADLDLATRRRFKVFDVDVDTCRVAGAGGNSGHMKAAN